MAQYFKSQISNYKITEDFSERKTLALCLSLEVRPAINISRGRGKCIGILLWNLTIIKKLTVLEVKKMDEGRGEH